MCAGGSPLTHEHRGVKEAVALVGMRHVTAAAMHAALGRVSEADAGKAAIGSVLNAFIGNDGALWCILQLDDVQYPLVNGLVQSGVLSGVSMTHIPATLACVEVTLTACPARPHAYIRLNTCDLSRASLYASDVMRGKINSIRMATGPLDITTILGGLAPEQAEVLTARFLQLANAATEANTMVTASAERASDLELQLEAEKTKSTLVLANAAQVDFETKQRSADLEVMRSAIRTVATTICGTEESGDLYGMAALCGDIPDNRVGASAMLALQCCNAKLMAADIAGRGPATLVKRKRAEEDTRTPLQRAIAREWTM
jgi:hypothetical protein